MLLTKIYLYKVLMHKSIAYLKLKENILTNSNFEFAGVDPKSVFCAFFKQGLCKKTAEKCKFSHDPDIEHKSAKRSIYTDTAKDEVF